MGTEIITMTVVGTEVSQLSVALCMHGIIIISRMVLG